MSKKIIVIKKKNITHQTNDNDNDNNNDNDNDDDNADDIDDIDDIDDDLKLNLGIKIHPDLDSFLKNDVNYIKSKTIKEILKTLNIDGEKFKKLESYLNSEIKII